MSRSVGLASGLPCVYCTENQLTTNCHGAISSFFSFHLISRMTNKTRSSNVVRARTSWKRYLSFNADQGLQITKSQFPHCHCDEFLSFHSVRNWYVVSILYSVVFNVLRYSSLCLFLVGWTMVPRFCCGVDVQAFPKFNSGARRDRRWDWWDWHFVGSGSSCYTFVSCAM